MNIQKDVAERLVQYQKKAAASFQFGAELRYNFEYIDREYNRKNDLTADNLDAKAKNRAGDKSALQDITIPVLQPQTEAAHTYLSGVFLSGYPIFSAVASPENEDAANVMDAYTADHSKKAGWARNLSLAMRKGLKYNIMAVEVAWEQEATYSLVKNAQGKLTPKPIIWQGNVIRDMDMYNTFWDTRVPPAMVHKEGEFAGYHMIKSRIALKRFMQNLPEEFRMNGKEAFECGAGENRYFVPSVTDKLRNDPRNMEFDWAQWATNDAEPNRIQYNNVYEVTVMYARIIPEDFKLAVPARSTPQIWKLVYVNGQVLIYAERLTNAHDYLPMIFGSPTEDGLSYQTLSYSENLLEIQDMSTALYKARMASARRNVSDRIIYDPNKIKTSDINSNSPSAKIPIRPGSYGTDIRTAVYALPFNDQSSNSLVNDTMQVIDFGRSISGANRASEGQFTKGNRTLGEYQDTTDNSQAKWQVMALFLEDQFYTPIKEIIKHNILQYAQPGQIYIPKSMQNGDVDPQALQDAALDFKMSDGLLPSSKIADTDFLSSLLQLFMSSPELQQQFDSVKLLNYIGGLRNVPGLAAFARTPPPGTQQPPNPTATPTSTQPQNGAPNAGTTQGTGAPVSP